MSLATPEPESALDLGSFDRASREPTEAPRLLALPDKRPSGVETRLTGLYGLTELRMDR